MSNLKFFDRCTETAEAVGGGCGGDARGGGDAPLLDSRVLGETVLNLIGTYMHAYVRTYVRTYVHTYARTYVQVRRSST